MLGNLRALLLAAAVSACAVSGPPRGPVPLPADLHSSLGRPTGSSALGAPADWTPKPTIVTPAFPVPAPRLLAAMQAILLAAPRTWLTVAYPDQLQAFLIVRSRAANLPDIVVVAAVPDGEAASRAVIVSQSRYDALPFANRNAARVRDLVDALTRRFGIVQERHVQRIVPDRQAAPGVLVADR